MIFRKLGGIGSGIASGLYDFMFERLQAGKYLGITKTPADDAVAAENAREPFKTPDEIRQFINDGSRPVSAAAGVDARGSRQADAR